ncbi:hypothetical protein DFQ27_001565 [Actinomortierella ambigua]|uniref:BTB domain-containing protein n=1 Tax=Actinomortierella ambigua TaxID=1343610 RepID=A0A9P6QC67_9FUNG|nr:hypothetical protein DFQ27_001565 [Actinomortierella ambigua]
MTNWLRRSAPAPPNAKGNDRPKPLSVASSIHLPSPFGSSSASLENFPPSGKLPFSSLASLSKDSESTSKNMKRFLMRMKSKEDFGEISSTSAASDSFPPTPLASDTASPMLPRRGLLSPPHENSAAHMSSVPSSSVGSTEEYTPGTSPPQSPAPIKPQGRTADDEHDPATHALRAPGGVATRDSLLDIPMAANGSSSASIRSSNSSVSIYREAKATLDDDSRSIGDSDCAVRTGSVHATQPTDNIHMTDLYALSHLRSEVASMVSVPTLASAPSNLPSDAPMLGDFAAPRLAPSSPASVNTSDTPLARTAHPRTLSPPINEHPPILESVSDNDESSAEHRPLGAHSVNDHATPSLSPKPSTALSTSVIATAPAPSSSSIDHIAGRSSMPLHPSLAPIHYGVDAFQLLRNLFNNPLYSDLTLTVGDSHFYVHRGILAQQSAYFQDMFVARRTQDPTSEMRHLDITHGPIPFSKSSTSTLTSTPGMLALSESRTGSAHPESAPDQECGQGSRDESSGPNQHRHEDEAGMPSPTPVDKFGVATSVALSDDASVREAKTGALKQSEGNLPQSTPSLAATATTQPQPPALAPSTAASWPIDMETLIKSSLLARHFGLFLALMYGIQTTHQLALEDLLPTLHITHAFRGPARLLTSLAHRLIELHQSQHHHRHHSSGRPPSAPALSSAANDNNRKALEPLSSPPISSRGNPHHDATPLATPDSWPSLIRFADYYGLDSVRRWAIAWASHDRRLWNTAVGCLDLDDYKLFLRGIRQEPAHVKNDLLLVFLAYHYQDRERERDRDRSGNTTSAALETRPPAFPNMTAMDITIAPNDSSTSTSSSSSSSLHSPSFSSSMAFSNPKYTDPSHSSPPTISSPLSRKGSLTTTCNGGGSLVGRVPSIRSHYHHLHHNSHRYHHHHSSTSLSSFSPLQQLSRVRSIRSLRMDRVDRAKAWTRRLKVECECDDDRTVLD